MEPDTPPPIDYTPLQGRLEPKSNGHTMDYSVLISTETYVQLGWLVKAYNQAPPGSEPTTSRNRLADQIIREYIARFAPQLPLHWANQQQAEQEAIEAAKIAYKSKEAQETALQHQEEQTPA